MFTRIAISLILSHWILGTVLLGAAPLRVAIFEVDASPPVGSPLAYDPTKSVTYPLSCKGVVLLGKEKPIVLCAVDWIGISNGGYKLFRSSLAAAAGTEPERVAVHTLHQHDAPRCDFSTDELLAKYQINDQFFAADFARGVIDRAAEAVRKAVLEAEPVTHIGLGEARVRKVASNRRILGPDGKVEAMRFTACRDPEIRAKPTGVIDPMLKMLSLWNKAKPLVVLSYYATHPQSYYRTGEANPDFPGMARNQRQEITGVLHVHFNGAGGNIGAGKWNDGAHQNRQVLANRLAEAMAEAWESTLKKPLDSAGLGWKSTTVQLPIAEHLNEAKLKAVLGDESASATERFAAAEDLVWLRRHLNGEGTEVSCLRIAEARILHMPGELFVEYQLAAQKMRPDLFVAMAAYGEYGPGYIGTEIAYCQGGYETGPNASLVAPEVEGVLMAAMRKLLVE